MKSATGAATVRRISDPGFSSAPPAATELEETLERLRERFGSVQSQRVHARLAQKAVEFGEPLHVGAGKLLPDEGAPGIQFEQLTGFRGFNRQQTGRRQRAFARVVGVNAPRSVSAGG